MALGFYEGYKNAKDRGIAQQRTNIFARQQQVVEKAQIQQQAKERFALTFDAINQMVLAGKDSGGDMGKTAEAARQMASSLRPVADALGIPQELIDAKLAASLSQPSSQEIAMAEAKKKAVEASFTETAKQNAKTRADIDRRLLGLDLPDPTAFMRNIDYAFDPNVPQERRDMAMNMLNSQLSTSGAGFSMEITPEGGIKLARGEQIPKQVMINRGDIGKLQGQREELESSLDTVNRIEQLFETNPELFGAAGSITKLEQTLSGVSQDLMGQFSPIGEIVASTRDKMFELASLPGGEDSATPQQMDEILFGDEDFINSGAVDVLETTLKFDMLNAFTGGRRPLLSEIKEVKALSDLRGFTSMAQLRGRMKQVKGRIQRSIDSNQRLMEKGLTGEASTQRSSLTAPGSPRAKEDPELERALKQMFSE